MTGKIFINYRRGDDAGHTGRLFDRLQDVFPSEQLFLDVDNIAPGLDFVRVLNERVAECDIVLAVIGKGWLEARDAAGNRRLDDPDDFVRIEITSALNQGKRVIPVLVGEAQMPHPEELPEPLQPMARRNAVRLTHERFRADTQGLVKAIQQGLAEIDAQRKAEAEATRRAREEEERRREAAEVQRQAEAEVARRAQAEQERQREAAEATRRAEEERAFAEAKGAGTLLAYDAFLVGYPAGTFAGEARKIKAALLAREEAYRRTATSHDPAELKSFIATYKRGADVDQVRRRLRVVEPQRASRWTAALIPAALAVLLIAGASAYWFKIKQAPQAALPAAQQASSAVPELKTPPGPSVDAVAWTLLRDTTDQAAIKRFIAQYPNSPQRKEAETRIATLATAEAERAEAAAIAEAELKAQAEAARLVAERAKAEAEAAAKAATEPVKTAAHAPSELRITSAIPPDTVQAAVPPLEGSALIQAIKMELARVGCYNGKLDDDWTSPIVKRSIVKFVKAASLPRTPDDPSAEFLSAVRNLPGRVCPLECTKAEIESNGKCVAKTCPSGEKLGSDGDCQTVKQRSAARPSAAEAPAKSRPAAAGTVAAGAVGIGCGRFGCKSNPVVNAPAGLPCKHAWQGRRGGWNCAD